MECPHGYAMQFVKDLGCDECLNDLLDEIEQDRMLEDMHDQYITDRKEIEQEKEDNIDHEWHANWFGSQKEQGK